MSFKVDAQVYESAADEIDSRGWTQGKYTNEQGQVCAAGAIRIALGGYVTRDAWGDPYVTTPSAYMDIVHVESLFDYLRESDEISGAFLSLPDWNDNDYTTKEDVVNAFRKYAAHLRDQEGNPQ